MTLRSRRSTRGSAGMCSASRGACCATRPRPRKSPRKSCWRSGATRPVSTWPGGARWPGWSPSPTAGRWAASAREQRVARPDISYDVVTEAVQARLEAERVRRCLGSLTQLQQESITLAYYRGRTYREVAALLDVPVGTVKTRMRDGLIRLRDCLGVE